MKRIAVVVAVLGALALGVAHRRAQSQVPRLQYHKLLIGDACFNPCQGPLCCALVVAQ